LVVDESTPIVFITLAQMKKFQTFSFFIITAIAICIPSCKKETLRVIETNCMDTTVNVNLILQIQNTSGWAQVDIRSFPHDNTIPNGSDYYGLSTNKMIFSPAGDTSHVNICSDTLHYELPIKVSRTKSVNILISMAGSSYHGSVNGHYQDIIFIYYPASRTITSTIYPIGVNPFNDPVPPPSTVLSANTAYDLTCKPGKWILYAKCE